MWIWTPRHRRSACLHWLSSSVHIYIYIYIQINTYGYMGYGCRYIWMYGMWIWTPRHRRSVSMYIDKSTWIQEIWIWIHMGTWDLDMDTQAQALCQPPLLCFPGLYMYIDKYIWIYGMWIWIPRQRHPASLPQITGLCIYIETYGYRECGDMGWG